MLKKIVILLILLLWPLNLLRNQDVPKLKVPQTILENDYQAEQLVLRNIHLYPGVFLARLFQNKARIYLNKFADNFFALTDLNNYFFGFHPRPIVPDNKNLFKFPFVAIIFFVYGIYKIQKYKYKKGLVLSIIAFVTVLSLLKNFDGYDFILWIPLSLILIHGINIMAKNNQKMFQITSILFVVFAIPEFIRIFIKV